MVLSEAHKIWKELKTFTFCPSSKSSKSPKLLFTKRAIGTAMLPLVILAFLHMEVMLLLVLVHLVPYGGCYCFTSPLQYGIYRCSFYHAPAIGRPSASIVLAQPSA